MALCFCQYALSGLHPRSRPHPHSSIPLHMRQSLAFLSKHTSQATKNKASRLSSKAPPPSLEHFIQRQRVISLWRTIVRSIYKTPKDRRPELLAYAKGEFARHKNVTDLAQIRYLISTGKVEFDQIERYIGIEMMGR